MSYLLNLQEPPSSFSIRKARTQFSAFHGYRLKSVIHSSCLRGLD